MARCLALLGMVSTHMLASREADGSLTFVQGLAGGRSAALFAVLAGVALAFMTGRQQPVRGRERVARSAGIAVRALVIAAIGLALGALDSGLAVILTYYGLLFLVGLLFVGLDARSLLALTSAWVLLAPTISALARPHLPRFGFGNPQLSQLANPGRLLPELALTGYYPVLPWVAYLLAGMGLGRLALPRRGVQVWIFAAGAVLAVGATAISHALTARASVTDALVHGGGPVAATGQELLEDIAGGMHGTTPAGGPWQWLLVVAPHSSTPFDLAQTIGSSLVVIGACLLFVGVLSPQWRRRVAVAFGAGTMTLSLYSLHVVMRTPALLPPESSLAYQWHVVILLGVGALFVHVGWRGPLEALVATLSRRTATLVRGVSA